MLGHTCQTQPQLDSNQKLLYQQRHATCDKCPLCDSTIETYDHIWWCRVLVEQDYSQGRILSCLVLTQPLKSFAVGRNRSLCCVVRLLMMMWPFLFRLRHVIIRLSCHGRVCFRNGFPFNGSAFRTTMNVVGGRRRRHIVGLAHGILKRCVSCVLFTAIYGDSRMTKFMAELCRLNNRSCSSLLIRKYGYCTSATSIWSFTIPVFGLSH